MNSLLTPKELQESVEKDIKEIDAIIKRIEESGLVQQYKKATGKNELVLFEKKKEQKGDERGHAEIKIVTAHFDDSDKIDLNLCSCDANFSLVGSGHNNSNHTTIAHWNDNFTQYAFNGDYRPKKYGEGKYMITDYKKVILKLEEKLESKRKRAKVINGIKNGIMNIFSSKN